MGKKTHRTKGTNTEIRLAKCCQLLKLKGLETESLHHLIYV